ncbi:hypothetical protein UY3_09508 [Chelonia mydas]|uniref:Myb/SANT-like DNA-binding domain-containing protein n=1 Tax=Chelonia mydas TaxID=8469 RepID=M7B8A3_CHEMY|nr:hypothetical protein UY3_09508 [Chelonia mydas]
MMESQNRKRAPAWTEREVRDLIAVWGEESVLSELRSSFRNAKTLSKSPRARKDRGHNRDPKQCRVKLKELRQAYQKTREANGRSGSEPQTCRFYDELHAILGGSATTTPAVLFDSFNGDGGNTEAGFGDEEEDDDDEVVDSSQQASGETGFPDSQEPTQDCLLDPPDRGGTSGAPDRPHTGDQTISCHKAMSCCCVAMQYRVCQHPGHCCPLCEALKSNCQHTSSVSFSPRPTGAASTFPYADNSAFPTVLQHGRGGRRTGTKQFQNFRYHISQGS